MTNETIEFRFILVARAGIDHTEIILAPGLALRSFIDANTPPWVAERYTKLQVRIDELSGAK